jgi:hypothetical protein
VTSTPSRDGFPSVRVVAWLLFAIVSLPDAGWAGQSDGTLADANVASAPAPAAGPAPRPVIPPDVITRDAAGRPTVRAIRIHEEIVADGRLDEAIYQEAPPINGFIQIEPSAGAPATEPTDVWVLFDSDHIYLIARCWESEPDRMVLDEMRRDNTGIAQNEQVAFALDTFHDRRNGFVFETNALGGRLDMQVTNESANRDWNAIYEAATGWFEGGWVLEVKVPFKSLRYRPGPDQVWA